MGEAVANFTALGIVHRDLSRGERLHVLLKRFSESGDERYYVVVCAGLGDGLPVVTPDDGARPSILADDERRVPGDVARREKREHGITVDLAFTREGNPAIDVEFAQELNRLVDLLPDEHMTSLAGLIITRNGGGTTSRASRPRAGPRLLFQGTEET